jgi:CRISPR-associated protein Csm2
MQQSRSQSRGSHSGRPPSSSGRQGGDIDVSKITFGNVIDAKLYSDIAEQAAKSVAGDNPKNPRNKPSQLRRFFDELVMLQSKVGSDPKHFEEQEPFIQMLKAKVAYARGRDKVDSNFVSLLGRVVDQARDAAALRQARLFMEAFMAFYKVYRPSE